MIYQKTEEYLNSFVNYEKTLPRNYRQAFKTGRITRLLKLLGDPHKGLKTVHIAGTKGKGSTAILIASVLKEANLHVGLYTSPHLTSFRERIKINDKMIEEESLSRIVTEIKPHLERMRNRGLSFFEICTAIAFLYFKEKKVDIAIIEVGLGGRLDATNAVESKVAVITPISLDHTHILGATLRKIAREKAGIIKKNSITVSAPQKKEALDVIKDISKKRISRLYLVGRDIYIDKGHFTRDIQYFNVWGKFKEYPLLGLRLRGEHQITNAATAIAAIEALQIYNIFIPQTAIKSGIRKAEWAGRMEVLHKDPLVIVDGAQNVASAKALVDGVNRHFKYRELTLILGMSKDKDIKGICETLSNIAKSVILTRAHNPRAADPNFLKRYIKDRPSEVIPDSRIALDSACSKASKNDLILVAGSLFLAGEIRRISQE